MSKDVADALKYVFESTTEYDSGGLPANVVDGLFAIARALEQIGSALESLDGSIAHAKVGEALEGLRDLPSAIRGLEITLRTE